MQRRNPKPAYALPGTTPVGHVVGARCRMATPEECLEGLLPAVDATATYLKTYLPLAGDPATCYRSEPNRANWAGYWLAEQMTQQLGEVLQRRVGARSMPDSREVRSCNLSECQNVAVIGVWLVVDKLLAWFASSGPKSNWGPEPIPSLPAELLSQFENAAARLRSVLPQPVGRPKGLAAGPQIAAADRTKPMSYREAARLMGKEDSQDAAEWLSKSVADGSIPCEHITRQTHVFSR